MEAQQIAGDYFLFFDRKNAELGLRNFRIPLPEKQEPDFTKEKPIKLETKLKSIDGRDLGRKVVVLFEENSGENGVEISLSEGYDLTVKISETAYNRLDINGVLFASLNGDGIVRMRYGLGTTYV